jgi:anti-anti-sigma factor
MVKLVTNTLKYGIAETRGWVVISPTGKAENNEPLRVRHLIRRWIAQPGVRLIVNLEGLQNFGVWEVGVLTSIKKEVDQRAGRLRLCRLNPKLEGYFQKDRFAQQFEIYADVESAIMGRRN